jgi:hypothetical protein
MSRLKRKILVRIFTTDLQGLAAIIWLLMLAVIIPVLFRMGILRLRWDPSELPPWPVQIAIVVAFLAGFFVFLILGMVLASWISQIAAKHFMGEFQGLFQSFRRKVNLKDNNYEIEV